MIRPSFEEFKVFSESGLKVPVFSVESQKEDIFDLAAACSSKDGFVFLESLKGDQKISRYSILTFNPSASIPKGSNLKKQSGESGGRAAGKSALRAIERVISENEALAVKGAPPFVGGAIGFLSYDACRWFEAIPNSTLDDVGLCDVRFNIYPTAMVHDRVSGLIKIVTTAQAGADPKGAYAEAVARIDAFRDELKKKQVILPKPNRLGALNSNMTQEEFQSMVLRAKDYIFAGDIFQANLSIRLDYPFEGESFKLYELLRKINPAPFAAYMSFNDFDIVSSSPERLISINSGRIQTRPIAGTRRRGVDFSEDGELSLELLLSEKERAEHIMLVDLERNDIGRISAFGSVMVDELMALEKYSHVIHIVSNITGTLLPKRSLFDIFSATFPGGTITGCPKIRSMEIIDELEPTRRGIYTGSMGYISFTKNMDFNIAIRTILIKDNRAFVQAGAGIVADSDPKSEYQESLQKAEALLRALKEFGS